MLFWSPEFFESAASLANSNPELSRILGGIATTIIAECTDRQSSFVIDVREGKVTTRPAPTDAKAEFKFSAPYLEWVSVVRDGLNIQGEVVRGRVKFAGSLPKMLFYLGKVGRMEREIIARMKTLNPDY